MNLDRMIAKCSRCNAVFSFASQFSEDVSYKPTVQKPKVARPKTMTVSDTATELKITHKWFNPIFYFLAVFSVIWNGMLLPFLLVAFASGQWTILLFMSLHIAAGLTMLYWTLALLLNSTEVKIDRSQLSIQHGPLPAKRNLTISARDITQIYCKEKVTYGRNSSSVRYEVYALNRNQTRQQLVTDLPSAEDAVFLEQEIERFLRIEDRPIPGEFLP